MLLLFLSSNNMKLSKIVIVEPSTSPWVSFTMVQAVKTGKKLHHKQSRPELVKTTQTFRRSSQNIAKPKLHARTESMNFGIKTCYFLLLKGNISLGKYFVVWVLRNCMDLRPPNLNHHSLCKAKKILNVNKCFKVREVLLEAERLSCNFACFHGGPRKKKKMSPSKLG